MTDHDNPQQTKAPQSLTSLLQLSRRKFLHWTAALGFSAGAVGATFSQQENALAASDTTTLHVSSSQKNINKDATLNYYRNLSANTPYPHSFADPQWFKDNIPFLDCPDSAIQDVYYYRWSGYRRHIRYTVPGPGYVITEFLENVDYAGLYSTINAAASHHIYEGRWLHNQRYLNDYQSFWLSGADNRIQPRQYSFWIADSYYARYLVNSDQNFLTGFLNKLDANYQAWATPANYNPTTGRYGTGYDASFGLYYQTPVWDAMEFSLSSYQDPTDPYHGGEGYRPTINAYMYGDAQAIAQIAQLAGNHHLAAIYRQQATKLKAAMQAKLWNAA
ncbi:MAG TPA: trehalase family glycosidase, partial [Ktedonobacteraceae bacterium]|nr:trehalase family glycosidase [Ktedonobacteraceae bacterium]